MKDAAIRVLSSVLLCLSLYTFSSSVARSDGWGCEVLLCLSNPGGATEFAECRPPIERLWSHLAKGYSFPICSGVGFTATRPGYEPYYCDPGYRLVSRAGDHASNEVECLSTEPRTVSRQMCQYDDSGSPSGRWIDEDGDLICKAFVTSRPNVRSKPRYVDVMIEGIGRQRIWF